MPKHHKQQKALVAKKQGIPEQEKSLLFHALITRDTFLNYVFIVILLKKLHTGPKKPSLHACIWSSIAFSFPGNQRGKNFSGHNEKLQKSATGKQPCKSIALALLSVKLRSSF